MDKQRHNSINQVSERIIGAAITVHRELGPGLLESVYQACLERELRRAGLAVATQVPVPVYYRGEEITECGLRLDLLVDDLVVVELKAVDQVRPVHKKQLLTYLKLAGKPLGLLINFNQVLLKDGVTRIVNTMGKNTGKRLALAERTEDAEKNSLIDFPL